MEANADIGKAIAQAEFLFTPPEFKTPIAAVSTNGGMGQQEQPKDIKKFWYGASPLLFSNSIYIVSY